MTGGGMEGTENFQQANRNKMTG